MNRDGCPPGWATDQVFIYDNPPGTCDMSVGAYVALGVTLTILKGILAFLQTKAWLRRQRKLYAKVDRKKHYPVVPTMSIVGFIIYALFFPLTFANIVNSANGWSYAVHTIGWVMFGFISLFFLLKIVRLGRKLVPIIQEKRRNEMLEQLQRDEDDPPTYSSSNKRPFGSFTSNPMYDEDPPTYDENSSSQPALTLNGVHNTNRGSLGNQIAQLFPQHRALFNQQVENGRAMFERRVQSGKTLIGKQVQHGRNIFSKRPPPQSHIKGGLSKKVAMESPPPKNPMWEEDPPTTDSILDIVEPSLDRLKRLDLTGRLFFLNEVGAVFGQFIINFFILTVVQPGSYYIARIGFAFQANFLFQHAIAMNWQFGRVIYHVRESRRKSRRNENIESGLKKLRGQQLTIFLLSSICGVIYIVQATGTVLPHWYLSVIVMFFEVLANFIIYKTFSTRLTGKINELKKQRAKQQANGDLTHQTTPNGKKANTPNGNHVNGNLHLGALVPNPQAGKDGPDDPYSLDNALDDNKRGIVYKSSVAHVRESAKFVTTDSSRKGDEKEDIKSTAVSW